MAFFAFFRRNVCKRQKIDTNLVLCVLIGLRNKALQIMQKPRFQSKSSDQRHEIDQNQFAVQWAKFFNK